jgi:hypothetical protein
MIQEACSDVLPLCTDSICVSHFSLWLVQLVYAYATVLSLLLFPERITILPLGVCVCVYVFVCISTLGPVDLL